MYARHCAAILEDGIAEGCQPVGEVGFLKRAASPERAVVDASDGGGEAHEAQAAAVFEHAVLYLREACGQVDSAEILAVPEGSVLDNPYHRQHDVRQRAAIREGAFTNGGHGLRQRHVFQTAARLECLLGHLCNHREHDALERRASTEHALPHLAQMRGEFDVGEAYAVEKQRVGDFLQRTGKFYGAQTCTSGKCSRADALHRRWNDDGRQRSLSLKCRRRNLDDDVSQGVDDDSVGDDDIAACRLAGLQENSRQLLLVSFEGVALVSNLTSRDTRDHKRGREQ